MAMPSPRAGPAFALQAVLEGDRATPHPQHRPYTANLMKIGAMLQETLTLLRAWEGEPRDAFTRRILETNLVGKTTRVRLADLLGRVFWRRFPLHGHPGLADASAFVRYDRGADASRLVALYHAATAEPLLYDLLMAFSGPGTDTPFGQDGASRLRERATAGLLATEDVVAFVRQRGGATVRDWSPNTMKRTARGALAALRDFGVLSGRARKTLTSDLPVPLSTFLYVAHALRAEASGARDLALSPHWGIFLLTPADVELLFLQAHAAGHLRYYRLSDVWRIDWVHADLSALVAALAAPASDGTADRHSINGEATTPHAHR